MKSDCLVCLFDQALRTAKANGCDDECAREILKIAALDIASFSLKQTPPEAAVRMYGDIAAYLGKEDLFERQKIETLNGAFSYLDFVLKKIDEAQCKIDAALRASVAGNVIDFATQVRFDIEEEIKKIFEAQFAIDEKMEIVKRLKDAKSFMLIGDNVGEHLYDRVLLEVIENFYPDMEKYYVVRGRPIINDVTEQEAAAVEMDVVAQIVNSGVDTPGFLLKRVNQQTRALFESVDLIVAKGMGNFECMDTLKDERVFHLFKVKCSVVAQRVGKSVGDLVCIRNDKIKEE